ncbi:sensor domain-containing diguanylate cyclase [Virgibacillus salinus]|uniref:Diguanylate cyclase with GAF sensor n=1 Tax=Virgibacillus salinus TaxID=553311 RepID=A0A1H1B2P1_9BACI|nr:sensor domain-containing diguanylate cyclase [Virgibacillus salinus]SDQ46152.1 diguanylate cyclase with GAF sensor [Virgibacillus salinus]
MVSKGKMKLTWILWFILWPAILWLSYNYYYVSMEDQIIDILLFALFMCIVAWFPLTINDNPVFFVNGISIAVFLTFGLFVEIILTQIAIVTVLAKTRVGKKDNYRYPLNMIMFSLVSVIGAGVFVQLGGNHQTIFTQSEEQVWAIFGYAITIFIANQFFNKLIDKAFYKRKVKIFDEGLRWEVISSLLIIPVGFVLFVLYSEIGRAGIFYLGIPFVFISVILMLLYSYKEINRYLEKTGEIGHQLTNRMELSSVYNVFINEISDLLPIDYAYIYIVEDNKLKLEQFYDLENNTEASFSSLKRNEAFSGKVWATGKSLLYKRASDWATVKSRKIPSDTESVLSQAVEYGEDIIGVVTIESKQKKAFEKLHFQIMDILTNYLGVALENAKNYELTKSQSERDGLTQLYNFRYMENLLEDYCDNLIENNSNENFSLLLLDIDHFKKVNDIYGHEAGNEILCQIAESLKSFIGERGVIARYGGEEFIVFLPYSGLSESTQIAENIRSLIADSPFTVHKHIINNTGPLNVSITTSIGISVFPIHCETPSELIRHADRAMYIGAKRKGRNRVAAYEDLKSS